jgi:hypothetical protein
MTADVIAFPSRTEPEPVRRRLMPLEQVLGILMNSVEDIYCRDIDDLNEREVASFRFATGLLHRVASGHYRR